MSVLFPTVLHPIQSSDIYFQYLVVEQGQGQQGQGQGQQQQCPMCKSSFAVESSGTDLVCLCCGTIVDTPLEEGAEYRWFSSDSNNNGATDQSRCGFPVNHLMPESSLGTIILSNGKPSIMRQVIRNHMWNRGAYRELTLWSIFENLQIRASNAGISTAVLDEAKELFAQLTASIICRGHQQRDGILAACIWESLKRHGTSRLPRDIAAIFNIHTKQVTKGIKQFQHIFSIRKDSEMTDTYTQPKIQKKVIDIPATETDDVSIARANQRRSIWQATKTRITTFDDFIDLFLTNLSIPRMYYSDLQHIVRHVCKKTEELGIVPENTPPSLTASVIALCCREMNIHLDIKEISRVCGISAVTIQKCIKRMDIWKENLMLQ